MMDRSQRNNNSFYATYQPDLNFDWWAGEEEPQPKPVERWRPAAKPRRRWRFRPRSIWPLLVWGLILFLLGRVLLVPLVEGVYNYIAKTREVAELKKQYNSMTQQLETMRQNLAYMRTSSYVEEKSHQMGYVKPNESQFLVEPVVTEQSLKRTKPQKQP